MKYNKYPYLPYDHIQIELEIILPHHIIDTDQHSIPNPSYYSFPGPLLHIYDLRCYDEPHPNLHIALL